MVKNCSADAQREDKTRGADAAILLRTMQGQPYLREQLASSVGQMHSNWTVWVSDDGSTDGTHDILTDYAQHFGDDKPSLTAIIKSYLLDSVLSLFRVVANNGCYFLPPPKGGALDQYLYVYNGEFVLEMAV